MARNSGRPGRTVAVFFIVLAIAYGLVALVGTWKPALGLDLEGGTQITLIADGSVSKDNLNQAADIIDARVNGSGVSEAEVTTQGSNEIVVQVPGSTQSSLVETLQAWMESFGDPARSLSPAAPRPSHRAVGDPGHRGRASRSRFPGRGSVSSAPRHLRRR